MFQYSFTKKSKKLHFFYQPSFYCVLTLSYTGLHSKSYKLFTFFFIPYNKRVCVCKVI